MRFGSPIYNTKKEGVYRALRDAIMRCELEPGSRLVVDELSRQMGVSIIPIREALQQLQAEGLVSIVPYAGAVVTPVPVEAVDEVFALLEHIEVLLGPRVCQRRTEADLEELEALVEAMRVAQERGDGKGWADANSAFHRRVAAIAQMPLVEDIAGRVYDGWDRLRHYLLSRNDLAERMQTVQAEHRSIVAAIRARDREALEQVMRAHRRSALQAFHRAASARRATPEQDSQRPSG